MKNMLKLAVLVILVIVVALGAAGCSKQAGPKDDEVVKTITSNIESDPKGLALKSPIAILERKPQTPAGDWPVKVEYTVAAKDGSAKKLSLTYNFTPSIDSMGANIWLATETK